VISVTKRFRLVTMPTCGRCGGELAEGFRFCPACGAATAVASADERESRKVVTSLFCDVVGSTSLGERTDAETVRRVMLRYFDAMRAAVERHGGTVDKFVGDAVMAVFGVPIANEDDAQRAVRAALDMQRSLAVLNTSLEREWSVRLEIRIGINTGEALTSGMVQGQTIVLGDAVNVAARLQHAARAGAIVLGAETVRVAGPAVRVNPLPPLEAKGKAAPLEVFELVEIVEEAPVAAGPGTPFVGREEELHRLLAIAGETATGRSCRLALVTGAPGIGKSRLARELSRRLRGHATVHVGRCPSYGEGVTLRPLADIVRGIVGPQLHEGVLELLPDQPTSAAIATRIASALGEEAAVTGAQEETFWAFRRVFEAAAATAGPLVLILDDLHWAQPMLLDLVEDLVAHTRDAGVFLLALARADLLEARPHWMQTPGIDVLRLEPLPPGDSQDLVDRIAPPSRLEPSLRRHVIEQSEGNPLFLEQLLAFIEQTDDPSLRMPPTIQALLVARLDRLSTTEREVCERAAVIGRTFTRQMLAGVNPPEDGAADAGALEALVRKDLMRRAGDEYAFAHALVREAAYGGTPKQTRASLHEQVAARLVSGSGAGEHHRLVGHHLQQAYRLYRELGRPEARVAQLRAQAAEHLELAGRWALDTADAAAAAELLRSAFELQDPQRPGRPTLIMDLVHALWMADLPREAARVIETLEDGPGGEHEQALACTARAMFLNRYGVEKAGDPTQLEASIETLEKLGDHHCLARARWARAMALALSGRLAEAERECEAALQHARAVGDHRMVTVLLSWLADYAPLGPVPVTQGLDRCRGLLDELRGMPFGEVSCCWGMALLHAMADDAVAAADRLAAARAILDEVSLGPAMRAWAAFNAGLVELLAGEAAAASA
jgi:class 3 adenylate cyclase